MDLHHITPIKTYIKVLALLLFLTFITVIVAKPVSGFDLGHLNTFVAFAIATVKAVAVGLIFMGLKHENKVSRNYFISAILVLLVLFSFLAFDIATREVLVNPL
ncbi:MAG: cytochrome-c oxidase [Bdellovibrionales bacterium]|nr:cytochrome-c oxidase [Bdellovibrionales bacterium]